KNNSKLAVLIDESTSISKCSVLVVCIKSFIPNLNKKKFSFETEPPMFCLDLIELKNTSSLTIFDNLLSCLETYGFTHNYLSQNITCFASDGASNMIGKKSGVATLLMNKYPNIIVWHCSNHSLELAIGDVVDEVA